MCCTCTELRVFCSCSFLPETLWGWGWFNCTPQLCCGFGSNTLWQRPALQALLVQLLLLVFQPAGKAHPQSETVPFGCPRRARRSKERPREGWGGEAAQRDRVLPFPAILFLGEGLTFCLGRHRETAPSQDRHHWELWKLLPLLVGLSRNRICQGWKGWGWGGGVEILPCF